MPKPSNQIPAIWMPSPVLITESEEEFNSFCDALKNDLKVSGTIWTALDEYAIEAEAIRIVTPELEKLDRLLASLEWRLNKSLRSLADLRGGFLRHLRAGVERVIDGEILGLDSASTKKPPASA